jgi:hypothetical protein
MQSFFSQVQMGLEDLGGRWSRRKGIGAACTNPENRRRRDPADLVYIIRSVTHWRISEKSQQMPVRWKRLKDIIGGAHRYKSWKIVLIDGDFSKGEWWKLVLIDSQGDVMTIACRSWEVAVVLSRGLFMLNQWRRLLQWSSYISNRQNHM